MDPKPIPFPANQRSVLLILNQFVGLLLERCSGGDGDEAGCDYPLPGGLSLDAIACSLLASGEESDTEVETFMGQGSRDCEELLAGITDDIRSLLDSLPDSDVGRN